jgi:hypothetical protein
MSFQEVALHLLSEAKAESAVTSLKKATDSLGSMTSVISDRLGGGSEVQLAFAGMALLIALLTALLLLSMRKGPSHGAEDIMARLDLLEIALREAVKSQSMSSDAKGTIGYFKQELGDIRHLTVGVQHQVGALEETMKAIETRLNRGGLTPTRENTSRENAMPPERFGLRADGRSALGPDAISEGGFFNAPRTGRS